MGQDVSPDSYDLNLDNPEELEQLRIEKAREDFYENQNTPEYFKNMNNGQSPEITPERDVPQGYSPRANYQEESPPYGSNTPEYDLYSDEDELDEEEFSDEEGEKTTSVVLNDKKPKLTLLSDIDEDKKKENDNE